MIVTTRLKMKIQISLKSQIFWTDSEQSSNAPLVWEFKTIKSKKGSHFVYCWGVGLLTTYCNQYIKLMNTWICRFINIFSCLILGCCVWIKKYWVHIFLVGFVFWSHFFYRVCWWWKSLHQKISWDDHICGGY